MFLENFPLNLNKYGRIIEVKDHYLLSHHALWKIGGMINEFVMKTENIRAKVMIIEDEKDLCFLLAWIVKKQNFFPSCVNSITEAKQEIKKINPEILFIDNHLPDGSGADFIGQVKKLCPLTKIIMITAHDSPREVTKAFNNGADYFISKPFNIATIANMLRRITLPIAG